MVTSRRTEVLKLGGVEVEMTRKSVKTVRLRVTPPHGRVAVSVPHGYPTSEVERFVASRLAWIREAQATVVAAVPVPSPLVDGGRAPLWGEWLPLTVAGGTRARAILVDGTIRLTSPPGEEQRALDLLYRRELSSAVESLRSQHEAVVGRQAAGFRFRRMTSRWGSCNRATGMISLNVALAERPPSALEYVLVHELVHLRERGHGEGFKAWMSLVLPGWRTQQKQLRGERP